MILRSPHPSGIDFHWKLMSHCMSLSQINGKLELWVAAYKCQMICLYSVYYHRNMLRKKTFNDLGILFAVSSREILRQILSRSKFIKIMLKFILVIVRPLVTCIGSHCQCIIIPSQSYRTVTVNEESTTLRKKCPYSELFWSVFSRIRTE